MSTKMEFLERDLIRQLMPIGTFRALSCSDEAPFSSDLDYYQLLEAKILLQVIIVQKVWVRWKFLTHFKFQGKRMQMHYNLEDSLTR